MQQKAVSSRSGILDGNAGVMKSLTTAQEATGKAHIVVQGAEKVSSTVLTTMAKAALKSATSSKTQAKSSSSNSKAKK